MTHAEMDELYELYVLGALETEFANEIDAHLVENCEHCVSSVHAAVKTTSGLAALAEPLTPPGEVRKRILAGIRPQKRHRAFSLAIPALMAACLALFALSLWSFQRNHQAGIRLRQLTYETNELRTALAVLARSQTRSIRFGQSDAATHGRVLLSPDGGLVVVGSEMPQIAQDKAFELWLIPAKGNPIPAGVFQSNRGGDFVHVAPQPVNASQVKAVAVTVEPKSGSQAPTTKPFLVINLG